MSTVPPQHTQDRGYPAWMRRMERESFEGAGVLGPSDLELTLTGAMGTSVGTGRCNVRGNANNNYDQGLYHCYNDVPTIPKNTIVADPTNPALWQIIWRVHDQFEEQGSQATIQQPEALAGTPSSGVTLHNRTGAALLPVNSLLLHDILVPGGATSILIANVQDRRQFACYVLPPVMSAIDAVMFEPLAGAVVIPTGAASPNFTSAALMYLPTRIKGVTRIRWKYTQNITTAQTGQYGFGIYDSSGREIVATAAVSLTGIAGSVQQRAEVIASTDFEPGMYWVGTTWGTLAGGSISFAGVDGGFSPGGPNVSVSVPNAFLQAGSGPSTPALPINLSDALSDVGGAAGFTTHTQVPLVALATS